MILPSLWFSRRSAFFHFHRGIRVEGVGPDSEGEQIGVTVLEVLHVNKPFAHQHKSIDKSLEP